MIKHHLTLLYEVHTPSEVWFQQWYCPVCGRYVETHWFPDFRVEVLEEGTADPETVHDAVQGGLNISTRFTFE